MSDDGLGLVIDEHHQLALERLIETPVSFRVKDMSSLPKHWQSDIPARNQGSFSCCVGGGLSGCFEHRNLVETGEFKRHSMWAAYIFSQKECNMTGRDQGATITGALRAANKYGCPTNDLCQMPASYTAKVPADAIEDALKHRHLGDVQYDCRSWDRALDWASNRDPLLVGGLWTDRHSRLDKDNWIETPDIYSGRSQGYHCRYVCGFSFIDCEWMLLLRNTHGRQHGKEGVVAVPERTWRVLNKDGNFFCLAFGDVAEREPARRSWEESKPGDTC